MLSRNVESSQLTLAKLFAPIVALNLLKRRNEADTSRALERCLLPTAEGLKASKLLSSWPKHVIQELIDGASLRFHQKGRCIAFGGEPKSSSSAFWVISGKLVQLPTKAELKACVANMPSLTHATVTGPAVFAALFGDKRKENATLALTQLQESIIDRLATFGAGSLIDADILLLGTSRKRSVRCQTDAMVLELPIAWLQTCLSRLPGAIRAGVISTSRLTVATWMAHCNDKPTISAMLSRNPVLAALSSHAMKALHQHLRPFIFLAGECICSDMYTSSTIFFLQCGRARQEPSNVSFRQRASSIGLNSLVSHQLPRKAGERQKVVANSYCELWGVPLRTVLSLLDEGSKAQCCLRALQLLQFHYTKLDAIACLRRLPVFSYITEPCVKAVATTLSAVVYPPGACVFAGRNKAKCGVFIVSGSARRSLPDSKESAPVDCGVPLSFCETLVGVPTKYTLRTETSCIILYSSRALLLEALSAFPDELQDIYAGAEKAVEGRGLHLTDDQLRAEERIREYVSKMKAKSDQSVESIQTKKKEQLEAMLMAKMEAENLVMSTLALQLNSLVESEVEVHRYNFLRGIEVDAFPEEKVEHPVGPSNQRSCFSIDVKGDVVFLEAGDASPKKPTREPPSPSTQIQANDELEEGQLGQSTFTSAVRGGGHPVGFPSPGLHLFQQPREHVLQLPSLKTELRIHRTVSQNHGKANRAVGLPPRLADVKTAVVHMKDKADGFDAKTAYRQHMLRRKP